MGDTNSLEWATTLLAFLAMLLLIPVFVFYYKCVTFGWRHLAENGAHHAG